MIGYFDNTKPAQYDEKHNRIPDWDENQNFQDEEYCIIHFRINCPSFDKLCYFEKQEDREAFYKEGKKLLLSFNIQEGTGHRTENLTGIEHLHIHPQDISGVVQKKKIKAISESVKNCATFSLRWVDIYEDVSTMTDDEFLTILSQRKDEIKKDLLESFKTKRGDLYRLGAYDSITRLCQKYFVRRKLAERAVDDGVCYGYISDILAELVELGNIIKVETDRGFGFRTRGKAG